MHELMARSVLRQSAGRRRLRAHLRAGERGGDLRAGADLDLWPKASEFGGPVKLIGCDPNLKGAPATGPANQALGIEGGYDYSFVPDTGHLLQIEKPQPCLDLTLAFLAKHKLA